MMRIRNAGRRLNLARFDRSRLTGSYVSKEQPSVIDNPDIKNGFYGAPAVCVVFAQKNFLYSIPDAFCCAENMVLMATELGVSSCIVARGEETFDNEIGEGLLKEWETSANYIARCFVLLGYCDGAYPQENRGRKTEAGLLNKGGYYRWMQKHVYKNCNM